MSNDEIYICNGFIRNVDGIWINLKHIKEFYADLSTNSIIYMEYDNEEYTLSECFDTQEEAQDFLDNLFIEDKYTPINLPEEINKIAGVTEDLMNHNMDGYSCKLIYKPPHTDELPPKSI
jgi:hypothetical protein